MSASEMLLTEFETFLETIPLEKYREELLPVKTVEQDLPRDLNPLPDIYRHYWTDTSKRFPDYESFFEQWWREHLASIDEFVRQYFWGCSYDFVRLGGYTAPWSPCSHSFTSATHGVRSAAYRLKHQLRWICTASTL